MKSIVATVVALGLASLAVLESGAHSIVYATPARRQAERRRLAYRMLEFKGIKIPPQRTCCTNWVCPDSVCVGSTRYRVERGLGRDFYLYDLTSRSNRVAIGGWSIYPSTEEAWVNGLPNATLSSMPCEWMAKDTEITPLDPATNIVAITYVPTDRCAIVFKNLVVGVKAVTNSFDFAMVILNAGLPEADRIAVLPPRLP